MRSHAKPVRNLRRSAHPLLTFALLIIPACGVQPTTTQSTDSAGGLAASESSAPGSVAAPAAPADALAGAANEAAARAIEEADILKIDHGVAYALHQFKGLILIDVSNPDAPTITGKLEFTGQPIEL